jgi:hypothetical protein
MGELIDVPADLPPDLEARVQEIMAKTGETRDEVINRLVKRFLHEVDHPSEKAPALALRIRRAIKESGAGG